MRLTVDDAVGDVADAAALTAALARLRGPNRAETAVLDDGAGAEIRAVQWGPWWRVERQDREATHRALRHAELSTELPDRGWLTAAATARAAGEFAPDEVEALFRAFLEGSAWPADIAWEAV